MEKESYLSESFKIFRLKTTSEDDGHTYETVIIPLSKYEEFLTKEKAMERLNALDSWDEYVILPVIRRQHNW